MSTVRRKPPVITVKNVRKIITFESIFITAVVLVVVFAIFAVIFKIENNITRDYSPAPLVPAEHWQSEEVYIELVDQYISVLPEYCDVKVQDGRYRNTKLIVFICRKETVTV